MAVWPNFRQSFLAARCFFGGLRDLAYGTAAQLVGRQRSSHRTKSAAVQNHSASCHQQSATGSAYQSAPGDEHFQAARRAGFHLDLAEPLGGGSENRPAAPAHQFAAHHLRHQFGKRHDGAGHRQPRGNVERRRRCTSASRRNSLTARFSSTAWTCKKIWSRYCANRRRVWHEPRHRD